MFHFRPRRGWEIRENHATPEHDYLTRRQFLAAAGGASLAALVASATGQFADQVVAQSGTPTPAAAAPPTATPGILLTPNPRYAIDRAITPELAATTFNNFFEFTTSKDMVANMVTAFETRPWEVQVGGLVDRPRVLDVDDLRRLMPIEERLYRFRCVETWAMANPWTGFPLKALIDLVSPQSKARFVHFVTFLRPSQAPGQLDRMYPWPYSEGLSIDEALNELSFLATGMYDKDLPRQNGAPLRLVVPWKYGYKSIKSIVRIEFSESRPATFWNTVNPREYPFESNVDPRVPHPRWSQESEFPIGSDETRDTLLYNGYGEFVAHLYS